MTFNVELAQDVLDQIDLHPETWDQNYWAKRTACGTSYCFAGWSVAIGEPAVAESFRWEGRWDLASNERIALSNSFTDPSGWYHSIAEKGQELLGISSINAHILFNWKNTLDDIRAMIKFMIAHPGVDMGHYTRSSYMTGEIVHTWTDPVWTDDDVEDEEEAAETPETDSVVAEAELIAIMEADRAPVS